MIRPGEDLWREGEGATQGKEEVREVRVPQLRCQRTALLRGVHFNSRYLASVPPAIPNGRHRGQRAAGRHLPWAPAPSEIKSLCCCCPCVCG